MAQLIFGISVRLRLSRPSGGICNRFATRSSNDWLDVPVIKETKTASDYFNVLPELPWDIG